MSSYHMLRVRLKKGIFHALGEAAAAETAASGVSTCISDIVRSALMDWMRDHYPGISLSTSSRSFIPSGLAAPPLTTDEDAELQEAAALLDVQAQLDRLVSELTAAAHAGRQ